LILDGAEALDGDVAEGAARAAVDAVRLAEAEALASNGLFNRALHRVRAHASCGGRAA
jgi:hypothetical protein